VYLDYSRTHGDHEAWLVDSVASFHMTPHIVWLCEYLRYDGGNVFLGDESSKKIIGRGKVKLRLINGRIRTLLGVLHIPRLAIKFIYVRKMKNAWVKIVFENETYRMVRGEMVFLKGVWIGNIYKIQGISISNGCNSSFVSDIGAEEDKTPTISGEKVMLLYQILRHIREKGLQLLHGKDMVEGMSNCSLDFDFCEHCLYGKKDPIRVPLVQ
jgi:hypothetical protein